MNGFQTFTPEQIYAQHGIKPRDVQAIGDFLGYCKPYSESVTAQIVEFSQAAKEQKLTIPQAIANLKPSEPV